MRLAQFESEMSHPINFYDIRLLRNKAVFSELVDIVLVLHDNKVVEGIRNAKERKINAALCQSASAMVDQLRLSNLKVLITKTDS